MFRLDRLNAGSKISSTALYLPILEGDIIKPRRFFTQFWLQPLIAHDVPDFFRRKKHNISFRLKAVISQ